MSRMRATGRVKGMPFQRSTNSGDDAPSTIAHRPGATSPIVAALIASAVGARVYTLSTTATALLWVPDATSAAGTTASVLPTSPDQIDE